MFVCVCVCDCHLLKVVDSHVQEMRYLCVYDEIDLFSDYLIQLNSSCDKMFRVCPWDATRMSKNSCRPFRMSNWMGILNRLDFPSPTQHSMSTWTLYSERWPMSTDPGHKLHRIGHMRAVLVTIHEMSREL